MVERTLVRILVDQDGKPFSMQASGSLSKELADSIANWKFAPAQKNGKRTAFEVGYTVPERQRITSDSEWALGTTWQPSGEMIELFDLARDSDRAAIQHAVKARNEDGRLEVTHGVALLHALFTENGAEVRKAREEHLLWMIENRPQFEILGGFAALIGSGDEPFADSELREKAAHDWLEQVAQHPGDFEVLDHAINFLRFVDGAKTLDLIKGAKGWPKAGQWLGHFYALQGMGVTGLDCRSGRPLVRFGMIPATPAVAAAREALLQSQDKQVVLSGLAALVITKGKIDDPTRVPEGYEEFCEALSKHATILFPGTSLSCKAAGKTLSDAVPTNKNELLIAKLKKRVQPVYPDAAKARFIQGTVELSAIVNQQGEVTGLRLSSGPFALLDSAYDAVKHWQYQPTMLNGSPISVQTKVIVNYTLQR